MNRDPTAPSCKRCAPIGIFDSGVGGLTVVKQFIKKNPWEQIYYFGDTARMPYGDKSSKTVERYAIENSLFLMGQDIKLLVVACNTAAAHSVLKLRELFNLPIVDVIEAGVEEVVRVTKNGTVGVLGTKGTINSGVYERKLKDRLPDVHVHSIACPLWAQLVEEDFVHHPATQLIVREYLSPLKQSKVDTLLLGCTHYPLLKRLIEEELPDITIIDSAETCAEKISATLIEHGIGADPLGEQRANRFYVSEDPHKFSRMAATFLGHSIANVEIINHSEICHAN